MRSLSPLATISSVPKTGVISGGLSVVGPLIGGAMSNVGALLWRMGHIVVHPVRISGGSLSISPVVSGGVVVYRFPRIVEDEAQKCIDEFYRRKMELLRDYEGEYVAFRDGRVIDSDVDRVALARRFYKTYGYVAVCISKVEKERRVVRAPAPRPKR